MFCVAALDHRGEKKSFKSGGLLSHDLHSTTVLTTGRAAITNSPIVAFQIFSLHTQDTDILYLMAYTYCTQSFYMMDTPEDRVYQTVYVLLHPNVLDSLGLGI